MRARVAVGAAAALALAAACSASSAKKPPGGGSGGSSGSTAGTGGTAGTAGTGVGGAVGGVGGTGGIITSGGTAGSSGAPPDGCAYAEVESDLLPANILFVVDRSGSMNCNLPPLQSSQECEMSPVPADPMEPTKWSIITSALKDVFAALPAGTSAGLTYFSNDNVCGVQSMPNVGVNAMNQAQLDALTISLDNVSPKGGTPIVGATILAYKHLHQQAQLQGNGFVVLITDGTDTCEPEAIPRLVDIEVPKARGVNIRTFAIGAPGSERGRALLSRVAWEGDTAVDSACNWNSMVADEGDCHFDMTTSTDFAQDLADALAQISGKALTCEFDIPASPDGQAVDLSKVNVDYYAAGGDTKAPILKDESSACDAGADGWQYNADQTKIVLCGSICDDVKADSAARVQIVLGCESVVK